VRFVVSKFIDASTAAEALRKEPSTPVHEVCAKRGEEPERDEPRDLIGFMVPIAEGCYRDLEPCGRGKN
jgi:hypothetical protein